MTRFSVGGDEEDLEDHIVFKRRRAALMVGTKKPRPPGPVILSGQSSAAAAAEPSSASGGRATATTSTAATHRPLASRILPLKRPVPVAQTVANESELESGEDFGTTSSDEFSSSEDESEEEEEEEEQQNDQRSGDQAQTAEPRVNPAPDGSSTDRESVRPIAATLTDTDVLDCPICLEALSPPVYQCENGHVACGSCCTKMRNKCGSCSWPIGYNRCRAIEKVLESVKISCRNIQHGCTETITYSKKLDHEKTCSYAPCSCPHLFCDYIGTSKGLYMHFAAQHASSSRQFLFNSVFIILLDNQKHVFLQEKKENILFVLNRSTENLGNLVNVVCIAPNSPRKGFSYNITVKSGESSIMLRTFADCTPKWLAQPPAQKYLVVPSDFIGSSGQLRLEIVIRKDQEMARVVPQVHS